jgi:hypothetical protein
VPAAFNRTTPALLLYPGIDPPGAKSCEFDQVATNTSPESLRAARTPPIGSWPDPPRNVDH